MATTQTTIAAASQVQASSAPVTQPSSLRGLALLQLIMLFVLPLLTFPFAKESHFVVVCPSQYAPLVLSLLIAGLLSTIISYIGVILIYDGLKKRTKLLLGCGLLPISALCYATWRGTFSEGHLDALAGWTAILSMCGALASSLESFPWKAKNREEWRQSFLFVDLPLLVISVAMVTFKYVYYDWSTNEFNRFVADTFPRPGSRTPEWEQLQQHFLSIIRTVFWIGFSAGVVTAQLIISQLSCVWIRLRLAFGHGA